MQPPYRPLQLRTQLSVTPGLYAEFRPADVLRAYICCYWALPVVAEQAPSGGCADERLVPDGCIDLVVSSERQTGRVRNLLVGTLEEPTRVAMGYDRWFTFGVRFYPGGLQPFLRESAHLFTGRVLRLEEVSAPLSRDLEQLVLSERSLTERVTAADRLLAARLRAGRPLAWEDTFQNALHRLYATDAAPLVGPLARELAVSERQFLRLFRDRTGLSPKQFARTLRFQRVLSMLHAGMASVSHIAQACGYADQAHLTREFADLAGTSPGRYAAALRQPGGFVQDRDGSAPID